MHETRGFDLDYNPFLTPGKTTPGYALSKSLDGHTHSARHEAREILGTSLTILHSFSTANCADLIGIVNYDGAFPYGLTLSGNTLYGTTSAGGAHRRGTVFAVSFSPQLSTTPFGSNVILTWPTKYAGFDFAGYTLQSTTNLGSSAI